MSKFEFVQELPEPQPFGGGRVKSYKTLLLREFAEALRQNSGAWGKWPTKLTPASARSRAAQINAGSEYAPKPLREGFVARTVKGELWVSHKRAAS